MSAKPICEQPEETAQGQLPRLVTDTDEIREALANIRQQGLSIGLVPTMGALHDGHLSLVEASRRRCDFSVVTIFVNPTQFGAGEDFEKYPRDLDGDRQKLATAGADLVFAPATGDIYNQRHATNVVVGAVAEPLEGRCRPGHFVGVATVVLKLFNFVPADVAFFGQKDYQQALVIRRMIDDLNVPIEIEICPIVRDEDGLALSSRNAYLSAAERQQSLALWRSLQRAQQLINDGERDSRTIIRQMRETFHAAGDVRIDYVAIADPETLEAVATIDRTVVALVAVRVGATRLIDNAIIEVS